MLPAGALLFCFDRDRPAQFVRVVGVRCHGPENHRSPGGRYWLAKRLCGGVVLALDEGCHSRNRESSTAKNSSFSCWVYFLFPGDLSVNAARSLQLPKSGCCSDR
jgi:hypothetical protein